MSNPNVSKTYLTIALLFFVILYTIFSYVLMSWYFNTQTENIGIGFNVSVKRFLGIPTGVLINGHDLDSNTLPSNINTEITNALQNNLVDYQIFSTINNILVFILIILLLWLFIPTGT